MNLSTGRQPSPAYCTRAGSRCQGWPRVAATPNRTEPRSGRERMQARPRASLQSRMPYARPLSLLADYRSPVHAVVVHDRLLHLAVHVVASVVPPCWHPRPPADTAPEDHRQGDPQGADNHEDDADRLDV